MAFRVERWRLKGVIEPGEEILASDLLYGVKEWPNLSKPPVLVVTSSSIYVLLSGLDKGVFTIPFSELAGVGRKGRFLSPAEIQLITEDEDGSLSTVTCVFHPHDRHELTADLITEHFFGRVIKDTIKDPPGPSDPNRRTQ